MEGKKKKKLAIVGCANSRTEAPWGDPEFEFWGVNNLHISMPLDKFKFDRWFEIHQVTQDEKGRFLRRGKEVFRGQPVVEYLFNGSITPDGRRIPALAELGIPVYMQRQWPGMDNCVVYPIEQVKQRFGNYLTNTISYQLALAIMEGFEEIHLYGVDMAVSSGVLLGGIGNDIHNEYGRQRPSCEYFLGIAKGMGIKIFIPDSSDLLKSRFMYAYDEPKQAAWDKKMVEFLNSIRNQKAKAEAQKFDAIAKENQALGAEMAIKEMHKVWQSGGSGVDER